MSGRQAPDAEILEYIAEELDEFFYDGEKLTAEHIAKIQHHLLPEIRKSMLASLARAAPYKNEVRRHLPYAAMSIVGEPPNLNEWAKTLERRLQLQREFHPSEVHGGAWRRVLRHHFIDPGWPVDDIVVEIAIRFSIKDRRREQSAERESIRNKRERQSGKPPNPKLLELLSAHAFEIRSKVSQVAEELNKPGTRKEWWITTKYLGLHMDVAVDAAAKGKVGSVQTFKAMAHEHLIKAILDLPPGQVPEMDQFAASLKKQPTLSAQRHRLRHEKDGAFALLWSKVKERKKADGSPLVSDEEFEHCKLVVPLLALGGTTETNANGRPRKDARKPKRGLGSRVPLVVGAVGAAALVLAAFFWFPRPNAGERQVEKAGVPKAPILAGGRGIPPQGKNAAAPFAGFGANPQGEAALPPKQAAPVPAPVDVPKGGRGGGGGGPVVDVGRGAPAPGPDAVAPKKAAVVPPEPPLKKFAVTVIVPMYAYPGPASPWPSLVAEHSAQARVVAILNPNSGPGKQIDPGYVKDVFMRIPAEVVGRKAGAPLLMIGYIAVGRGQKTLKAAIAEMEQWRRLYPSIDGFFIDESPTGPEHVPYIKSLREASAAMRVRQGKDGPSPLVLNPGTFCDPGYFPLCDVVCVFEDEASKVKALDGKAKAVAREYPGKLAALVHTCVDGGPPWDEVLSILQRNGIYTVYVTDAANRGRPDQEHSAAPWHRLPRHWREFMGTVRAENGKLLQK